MVSSLHSHMMPTRRAGQSDESGEDDEDPVEKKRDKEMQLRSDLDHAAALLGQRDQCQRHYPRRGSCCSEVSQARDQG